MGYREKENIANIISALLISGIYGWEVYERHLEGRFDLTSDYKTWGIIFLIFIGVSIVARIVIYIIFHILIAIATQEENIPVEDERDKLVKLKSIRNAHHFFSFSFIAVFIGLASGMPPYGILLILIGAGVLAEIIDNGSQIFYYRKGI